MRLRKFILREPSFLSIMFIDTHLVLPHLYIISEPVSNLHVSRSSYSRIENNVHLYLLSITHVDDENDNMLLSNKIR
jgi:hypothetical protein